MTSMSSKVDIAAASNDVERSKPPKKRRLIVPFLDSSSESEVEVFAVDDDDDNNMLEATKNRVSSKVGGGGEDCLDILAQARGHRDSQPSQANRSMASPKVQAVTQPTCLKQVDISGLSNPITSMTNPCSGGSCDDKTSHSSNKRKLKLSMSPVCEVHTLSKPKSVDQGSLKEAQQTGGVELFSTPTTPIIENGPLDLTKKLTTANADSQALKLSKADGYQDKSTNKTTLTTNNTKAETDGKSKNDGKKRKTACPRENIQQAPDVQAPPLRAKCTDNDHHSITSSNIRETRLSSKSREQKMAFRQPEPEKLCPNDSNHPTKPFVDHALKPPNKNQRTENQRTPSVPDKRKKSNSAAEHAKTRQPPTKVDSTEKKTDAMKTTDAITDIFGDGHVARGNKAAEQMDEQGHVARDKKAAERMDEQKQSISNPNNKSNSATESRTPSKVSTGGTPLNKKKKLTFQDQVLRYMLVSCKPFTLKALAKSLNTTEAALNYLMLSLVDKQLVVKKEFVSPKGVSKELYWANQESSSRDVKAALQGVPVSERKAAQDLLQSLQQQQVNLNRELAVCTREPSNDELSNQVQHEQDQVNALRQRLAEIESRIQAKTLVGTTPPATATKATVGRRGGLKSGKNSSSETSSCPRRLKLRINAMRDVWKQRKEKCMDFCEQLADGLEKKIKDVIKLLDLETDEMAKVTMPPKHVIDSSSK